MRGRLAAPGRPAEEDRPRGRAEEPPERRRISSGRPRSSSRQEPARAGEEPDDGLLAVERRERAEPHLDVARRARMRPSWGTSVR